MSTFTNLSNLFSNTEGCMQHNDYAAFLPALVWRDAVHACAVRCWLRARRREAVLCWYDEVRFTPSERATWQARAMELTELIRMTNVILRRVFGYRRGESERIPRDRTAMAAVWDVVRDDPTMTKFLGR